MISRSEIWKLQRPIFTSEPEPMIMAYTEDKSKTGMIPVAAEDLDLIFGDELKIYVMGRVEAGNLVIEERVEDQSW